MFNRYQASLVDRLNFLINEIDKGVEHINFELPDNIRIVERTPWLPMTKREILFGKNA